MRYALSQFKQEQKDKAYRIYVTDTLRLIAENTARSVGGKYITARFADVIAPPRKEENMNCREIVDDIVLRCGLVVKE